MSNCLIFGTPIGCLAFLTIFAAALLPRQARSTKDQDAPTKDHSERVYKDYEFYLKVVLALVAAFGYVRFEWVTKPETEVLGRQALLGIGGINLLVMVIFCIFIICHMGSKLRRWENIEWEKAFFWQELWACIAMWLLSSSIWIAAIKW